MQTQTYSKKALFLDRDGTLIIDKGYLHDPDEVELLPRVKEALQFFYDQQWQFFLFSNQSGVGRGIYTLEQAKACNQRLIELLGFGENFFSKICLATESPEQIQMYRKPSPRFILECLQSFHLEHERCWMIGDKLSDVQSGLSAGIHAALLSPQKVTAKSYLCFEDLYQFKNFMTHRDSIV